MEKEQAYIAHQQLEQKAPPYDDVQISTTSFQPVSLLYLLVSMHGDRDFTTSKRKELLCQ